MPNLDFYAVAADFDAVFEYVFTKSGCRVFESYSAFGSDLLEFKSVGMLKEKFNVGQCTNDNPSTFLQLVVPAASALYRIEKIDLSPEKCCGHTFRYRLDGWGLIQLYLGGLGPRGVVTSHTNHNSEARARAWQATYPDMGSTEAWDWTQVTSVSSAFNRYIRSKLSVSKLGSRPVLPAAQQAFDRGVVPAEGFARALLENRRAALSA
jgi:hypothetical protein